MIPAQGRVFWSCATSLLDAPSRDSQYLPFRFKAGVGGDRDLSQKTEEHLSLWQGKAEPTSQALPAVTSFEPSRQ